MGVSTGARIPLPAEALAQLGRVQEALRAVNAEVAKTNREISKQVKTTGSVSPELANRSSQQRELQERLQNVKKGERAAKDFTREAKQAVKHFREVQSIPQAAESLAQGNAGALGTLLRTDAARGVLRKLGVGGRAIQAIGRGIGIGAVVGFAVKETFDKAIEGEDERKRNADSTGKFWDKIRKGDFDPAIAMEKRKKAQERLRKLVSKSPRDLIGSRGAGSADVIINGLIEAELEAERAGVEVSGIRERVRESIIRNSGLDEATFEKMNAIDNALLIDAETEKAIRAAIKTKQRLESEKPPEQKWKERERELMMQIHVDSHSSRRFAESGLEAANVLIEGFKD